MELRISIRQADLDLLRSLCMFGYLTTKQIQNLVYKRTYRKALRRLNMLRKVGLVEPIRRADDKGSTAWIPVLENSIKVIYKDHRDLALKISRAKPWRWSAIEHEDYLREYALRVANLYPYQPVLIDIGLDPQDWGIFESGPGERRKLPDFVLDHGDLKVAFEIELHPKSNNRYFDIMNRLLTKNNGRCLYLVKNEVIKLKLIKKISEIKAWKKQKGSALTAEVSVCTFDEVTHDEKLKAEIDFLLGNLVDTHTDTQACTPQPVQATPCQDHETKNKLNQNNELAPVHQDSGEVVAPQTPPSHQTEREGFARPREEVEGEQASERSWISKILKN